MFNRRGLEQMKLKKIDEKITFCYFFSHFLLRIEYMHRLVCARSTQNIIVPNFVNLKTHIVNVVASISMERTYTFIDVFWHFLLYKYKCQRQRRRIFVHIFYFGIAVIAREPKCSFEMIAVHQTFSHPSKARKKMLPILMLNGNVIGGRAFPRKSLKLES